MDLLRAFIVLVSLVTCAAVAAQRSADLARDLRTVRHCQRRYEDQLPIHYNHLGSTGVFQTLSARMACDGSVALGVASVNPYFHFNFMLQFFPILELTGNYRIHRGQPDPILSKYGYGDFADRTLNAKLQLLRCPPLPELAVGAIDVGGRRSFRSEFVVATLPLCPLNLELSFGYGRGRMQGFFGSALWMPFRRSGRAPLQGLCFAAEYDPIDYTAPEHEPHPAGRQVRSRINYGVKYQLLNHWDFSVSRIRGSAFAGSVGVHLPLGNRAAMACKTQDPLPPRLCCSPDAQRADDAYLEALRCELQGQGIRLNRSWITCDACCERALWLSVSNCTYVDEAELRCRLEAVLGRLASPQFASVHVTITAQGLPTQKYCYRTSQLQRYAARQINRYQMLVQSPKDTPSPLPRTAACFVQPPDYLVIYPEPFTRFFFGSCHGKFQYALGANLFAFFSLTHTLTLTAQLAYVFLSSVSQMGDIDPLYPSQILNVRTDSIRYYQARQFLVQCLFLQQNGYLGRGLYGRASVGYFEAAYGGAAAELLYYPVGACFAVGVEAAVLWKRSYDSMGLRRKLRVLDGIDPRWVPYTALSQAFLELYLDVQPVRLVFQASVGQFLARDLGASLRATRYYPSGLELYLWVTATNARDYLHGSRYRNCGLGFEVPLDFFLAKRSKRRWGRAVSAWLRDSGARALTGYPLYRTIYLERLCLP